MAKSNRVRVDEMMDALRDGLGPYVLKRFKAKYGRKHLKEMEYALYELKRPKHLPDEATALRGLDVQSWLNLMNYKWNEAFRDELGYAERNYLHELRDVRNRRSHENEVNAFSSDDARRVADTAARLLRAVGAKQQAQAVERHKRELSRLLYERDAKKSTRQQTRLDDAPLTTAAGLKPWRQVIQPREDVTSGGYSQSDYALDLSDVVQGRAAAEYMDAEEFFQRTYLTAGLKNLLVTGFQRLSGRGGDPVVQLQTNFGGGKSHSMLALYHLFGDGRLEHLGEEADDIRERIGEIDDDITAKCAVIVGTAFDANKPREHADCTTYTLWGEIAWQLGGAEAYELVRDADLNGISPGSDTLVELLENYGPALIIIDELVAFARNLYDAPKSFKAGSFDSVMTFVQSLTEAVKRSSDSMLLVSIPASDAEVGDKGGKAALERIARTLGRIEAVWKPISATESFEIVRRRLFSEEVDYAGRDAVLNAFSAMYKDNSGEFPTGVAEADYKRRMRQAYPIHPELFARLYEDWSSMENFQRTRGVLRLMAVVIHQLWMDQDQSLMIMPGAIPLWSKRVSAEMLKFLPDGWGAVMDADIDGTDSKPYAMDGEVKLLGQHRACRRVARAIFVGSAPSVAAQGVRGVEQVRIRLATTQPGEKTAPFNDALSRMSKRLAYLYSEGSRYWYDTRPTVNRMAAERAQSFSDDDVEGEARRRLHAEKWNRGDFAAAHVAPPGSADVNDEDRARVVVLDMLQAHHRQSEDSKAQQAARDILENRGDAPRYYRNMLVFIAADQSEAKAWKDAIRDYLAWKSIDDEREELDLGAQQGRQVDENLKRAEQTLRDRLQATYRWLIVPTQEDPKGKIDYQAHRISGGGSFYERAHHKLKSEGLIIPRWSPDNLRMTLNENEILWRKNEAHLSIRQLWEYLARYCYLPRLYDENVLLDAIKDGVGRLDAPFGYATGLKDDGSYSGLALAKSVTIYFDGNDLIVRPEVAMKLRAQAEQAPQVERKRVAHAPQLPKEKKPKIRYYGRVAVEPDRANRDMLTIVEEIIQRLSSLTDAKVEITLEISCERQAGFDEVTVRTVSENSRSLKFAEHSFEE